MSIVISTMGALSNLTFVLAIIVYIFAVIGMQLFREGYTADKFYPDEIPRFVFIFSIIGSSSSSSRSSTSTSTSSRSSTAQTTSESGLYHKYFVIIVFTK